MRIEKEMMFGRSYQSSDAPGIHVGEASFLGLLMKWLTVDRDLKAEQRHGS